MDKKLRRKLYKLWHSMKSRCYNPNHPSYSLYGGRGVTVCDKWLTFDGFLDDIIKVDGYSESDIMNGKIHLDKDSKDISNKIYGLEFCTFVDATTNNKFKPNQMIHFTATSPSGVIYKGFNMSEFAREHNLNQSTISACLKGKIKKHKGWKFEVI